MISFSKIILIKLLVIYVVSQIVVPRTFMVKLLFPITSAVEPYIFWVNYCPWFMERGVLFAKVCMYVTMMSPIEVVLHWLHPFPFQYSLNAARKSCHQRGQELREQRGKRITKTHWFFLPQTHFTSHFPFLMVLFLTKDMGDHRLIS